MAKLNYLFEDNKNFANAFSFLCAFLSYTLAYYNLKNLISLVLLKQY